MDLLTRKEEPDQEQGTIQESQQDGGIPYETGKRDVVFVMGLMINCFTNFTFLKLPHHKSWKFQALTGIKNYYKIEMKLKYLLLVV